MAAATRLARKGPSGFGEAREGRAAGASTIGCRGDLRRRTALRDR